MRLLVPCVEVPPHFSYAIRAYDHSTLLVTTTARGIRRFRIGSRHRHIVVRRAPHATEKALIDEIKAYIALIHQFQIDIILCGTDELLRLFLRLKSEFGFTGRLCAPSADMVETLQSKVRARRFFETHGASVPKGTIYDCCGEIKIPLEQISFPVVLKRDISEGTTGVRHVQDAHQLEREIRKSLLLRQDFILEEHLGRTDEVSIQFFVSNGEVHPVYGLKKLSHFAPSYSSAVLSLSKDQLYSHIQKFHQCFAALEDGLYSAQLKLDAAGGPRLVEISARLGNNFRIVSAMWPQLTEAILSFYSGGATWRSIIESMEGHGSRAGVSPLEDLLGRIQRTVANTDGRLVGRLRAELGNLIDLGRTRPRVDDYTRNSLRYPSVCLQYYMDLIHVYVSDWQDRSRRLMFVRH